MDSLGPTMSDIEIVREAKDFYARCLARNISEKSRLKYKARLKYIAGSEANALVIENELFLDTLDEFEALAQKTLAGASLY